MNGPGSDRLIEIGEIKAAYGIKGWVKIFSYSRPIEQIFNYSNWYVGSDNSWQRIEIEDSNYRSNKGLIAKLKNIDDRNAAQSLIDTKIAIDKDELEQLEDGDFYWSQLIGLNVINTKSEELGTVVEMLETGAHDVLVVENELVQRLIPYDKSIVLEVKLESGQMLVDWETDY